MKTILTLVVMASLVCFGFLIPSREVGAVTINFTTMGTGTYTTTVANPINPLNSSDIPALMDLSAWAFSTQYPLRGYDRKVTVNSGSGLGVTQDGYTSATELPVNNGTGYIEGLILKVPESFYFTSITFSGLTGSEKALVRAVADFDIDNIGDFLGNFTGASEVLANNPLMVLGGNDWQWLLVRTPASLLGLGASSFYVAGVTYEPVSAGVPEPSTLILLGCGLIGVGVYRRMFRKS